MRKGFISVSSDKRSRRLIIYDGMFDENKDLVLHSDYDSIELSYGDWNDLSVLAVVSTKVLDLTINSYGHFNLHHLSVLHGLQRLVFAAVETVPDNEKLDFSWFPNLEHCEIHWAKHVLRNIFLCPFSVPPKN